ncbi:type 1 glutamine amidotransferase [Corynebacterium sp. NPDC060344]|uniref:type 1 glutamine amidotransferase n=1 Tax=Corynebacterium sp. NPDC060344 TaxID=3347101 RepID=UPI003662FD3E
MPVHPAAPAALTTRTATPTRRIVILQPDEGVPADRIGPWLAEAGAESSTVKMWCEPVPAIAELLDARAPASLIILGGRDNALNRGAYPWLGDLHALIRGAIAADVPVLGICLGHQILADALGGEVTVGHPTAGEEGMRLVLLDDAGRADPLFAGFGAAFAAAESHHDVVVRVPEGATVLASSEQCRVQAFRFGSAVGVQFHPEASPELMASWTAGDGGDGDAMLADMRAADDAVGAAGRSLIAAFAGA